MTPEALAAARTLLGEGEMDTREYVRLVKIVARALLEPPRDDVETAREIARKHLLGTDAALHPLASEIAAALAARGAAERERCAKIAYSHACYSYVDELADARAQAAEDIAAAIRSGGGRDG